MQYFAAFGLLLCLSGCGGYWYADPSQAGEVRKIAYLNFDDYDPCGKPLPTNRKRGGCWNQSLGIIFVDTRWSKDIQDCTLRHEAEHSKGRNHDNRETYAWDCGE